MRSRLFALAFALSLSLLAFSAEEVRAQICSVGCAGNNSCGGTGASYCETECYSVKTFLYCRCNFTPCDQSAEDENPEYWASADWTYTGPGHPLTVSAELMAITDCAGNYYGFAYSTRKARELVEQTQIIELVRPTISKDLELSLANADIGAKRRS